MNEALPAALRAIHDSVQHNQKIQSNLETLEPMWQAYMARLPEIPSLHVEYGGETVRLGELSPGCQACQDGAWDCVFLTHECNLSCGFCYSPQSIPGETAGSVFGSTPEAVLENYKRTEIRGVGFTGGEPFLQPQKLFEWLEAVKQARPQTYCWLYTNGMLIQETHLQRLAELGLDEIRFNTAASGYNHPTVMENLKLASRYVPRLTVEIPAIPEDAEKLLNSLGAWCARGVRYLNLHELIYEPGTNAAELPGERQALVTEDGHVTEFNPHSRLLTARVIRKVWELKLPLFVNDCSMQTKLRQVRGRRKSLAPLTRQPYERLVNEEFLESYCAYDEDEHVFFPLEVLDEMHRKYPERRFTRLVRRAPLTLEGTSEWVLFEQL
jgi:pyruvate formate-lyase activating enzyme-like uncharacterized protein